MLSTIFGPDTTRKLAPHELTALPATWMTAACMDTRFRRLSGWLGLARCETMPSAWTCRIAARPGIYGIRPLAVDANTNPAHATFQMFYFPSANDPMVDAISLAAAIAATRPNAAQWIRDFPAHPSPSAAFVIADMHLALTQPDHGIGLSFSADITRQVIATDGIATSDGKWLITPGSREENLPTFEIARDLFRVLVAGVAAATGRAPDSPSRATTPAITWQRTTDGGITPLNETPDGHLTECVTWNMETHVLCPEITTPADPAPYRLARVAAGVEPPDASEIHASERPQLVVLSGFLGSGKTSFLNQFIEFQAAHDQLVAVIQNELGATGVDAKMLEGDESVLAIDAGCVCCTLAGGLTKGIRRLIDSINPEIIVLETTGLANPMNMRNEFHEIDDLAELIAVVAVVDAARFWASLSASDVASDQIAAADTIILNKCDLVDDATRTAITDDIHRRNPQARIIEAEFGRVNPTALSEGLSRHAMESPAATTPCSCGCTDPSHEHKHEHEHEHHHHHEHGAVTHLDEGFSAIRLPLHTLISRKELYRRLAACPPEVFRVKGIARFADTNVPQVVQYVPGQYGCEPAYKADNDPPFLLVIGQHLDEQAVRRHWHGLIEDEAHVSV
ncbi:MAG: GTP-binding protein [Rhodospirillaceae bacterium]|nr:GTP-binding protein [Rhodospirillaceae bacterium]